MKNLLLYTCIFVTIFSLLCGCSSYKSAKEFVIPDNLQRDEGRMVSSDDLFALSFESDTMNIFFENKETGKIWATTPYDYYLSSETSYSLTSDIIINYYSYQDNSIQTIKSYETVENNNASIRVEDGTIIKTYYFTDAEIELTVKYTYNNGVLRASISSKDIVESGATRLLSISVSPNLCAVKNTENRDSYLLVPVGSGAIMYCDEQINGEPRTFAGEVYGTDLSVDILDNSGNEEPIRMPIFGAKDGNNAIMAIIESGDTAAVIEAIAGSYITGYSSVYPTFYVRGYNNVEWTSGKSVSGHDAVNDVYMLDEDIANADYTIAYYSLSGDDANYIKMADIYREYLKSEGLIQKSKTTQRLYNVTFVGGATVNDILLGLPHTSVLSISTYSETKNMLSKLLDINKSAPSILLKGYGDSGVDVAKIAGGYSFASVLGGKSGQKAIKDYCLEKDILLYNDFDIVQFSESGNGFSVTFDAAESANGQSAKNNPITVNLRTEDDSAKKVMLLKRAQTFEAVNLIDKKIGEYISGVGLSTYGRMSYSDFSDDSYKLKANYNRLSKEIVQSMNNSKHDLLTSAANAYVAGISDAITDAPLQNGNYDAFDEQIPFYEMVYKGYVPMYSEPINLAINKNTAFLNVVEAGISPSFILGSEVNANLIENKSNYFYGIDFESNISFVKETLARFEKYYNEVKNTTIIGHHILTKGVSETDFANGVKTFVNYNSVPITVEGIEIGAGDFIYVK